MTEPADDLDALSTEQLRDRAFDKAQHSHDLGFFWDLVKHLPASAELGSDDGSAGGIGETLNGLVELATGRLGRATPEQSDLVRAHYLAYLRP